MKCCKVFRVILKIIGVFAAIYAALFAVFFFDLDGKLMYHRVIPFLVRHYDKMPHRDIMDIPYELDKK